MLFRSDVYISHNNSLREIQGKPKLNSIDPQLITEYFNRCHSSMLGASGAVFGVLSAFAILFPNREFLLYFAIPVKAKYLVGVYFLFEVYLALKNNPNDHVAHLAHIGGAIMGVAIVLYWRKTDRTNFY